MLDWLVVSLWPSLCIRVLSQVSTGWTIQPTQIWQIYLSISKQLRNGEAYFCWIFIFSGKGPVRGSRVLFYAYWKRLSPVQKIIILVTHLQYCQCKPRMLSWYFVISPTDRKWHIQTFFFTARIIQIYTRS
jgi:hypothetical protein